MQKHTPFNAPKTNAPKTPVAPSLPKPIDAALLKHVSGGAESTCGPNNNW